jgi:hypothetical protein
MCHVHLARAVLGNVAKKYHKEIAGKLKSGPQDGKKNSETDSKARKQRIFQSC